MGGPIWYLSAGRLIWLGDTDWRRRVRGIGVGSDDVIELVISHELNVELVKGLFARATYSFHDPDIDQLTGSITRMGLGMDALVYPFLSLRASVLHREVEAGDLVAESKEYDQSQLMVHFLF